MAGIKRRKGEDRYFIPEEHRFAHAYCFLLHDLLTDIVVQGEKDEIFKVHISDGDGALRRSIENKKGEELITWLEQNGHEREAVKFVYKMVCLGLLSDLCHFVYEALRNSEKAKLTVCYALLRKPFTDNLFYLEWLLAEPVQFLTEFRSGDPARLDLFRNERLQKREERLSIIKKAIQASNVIFSDADVLYSLRYDKGSPHSFQYYWQHANHLITTQRQYKTAPVNFNFLYSGEEERAAQWTFLYTYLPILLIHAYDVVESLIGKFALRKNHHIDVTDLRVRVGFSLWFGNSLLSDDPEAHPQVLEELNDNSWSCPTCESRYRWHLKNAVLFYETGKLRCDQCRKSFDFASLINSETKNSRSSGEK